VRQVKGKRGQFSLLGLVVALAIVYFMAYILLNTYFKMSVAGTRSVNSGLMPEVATPSVTYRSVIDSTRSTLTNIDKEQQKRLDAVEQQ